MVIVGIDPGLHITGYGVIESSGTKTRVLEAGIIRTDQNREFELKLNEIHAEISKIIAQFKPDYIAVEELYSHYAHPRTAIIMGHARGVVFLQAAQSGIPVVSYASTRIKKSLTGNGRASKSQVQRMIKTALKLKTDIASPDTADALAAALCHHNALLGKQ
ncbi:MAG: crossover junction endodeoxyribonuclease RuvC [Candidatus Zixiibacteriota bacterium]